MPSVGSRPPSEMDASPRALLAALAVLALATARAHIASHDNILRIQLWDAEGLTREPITTTPTPDKHPVPRKSKVNLNSLHHAMIFEDYGETDFGRFTRHKVRHKRRRPRQADGNPWRFHEGDNFNVAEFDEEVPLSLIETVTYNSKNSEVSDKVSLNATRDVSQPMGLRQDEDEEEEVKKLPVVPKCCPSGQNLSAEVSGLCQPTMLTFQPDFFDSNDTYIFNYDSNVYETLVGNPCKYGSYKLDPELNEADMYFLFINGTLLTPLPTPVYYGTTQYCMETFYNESNPAGVTLPSICFMESPEQDKDVDIILVVYATGLIISVPFLLATACVYITIIELRDTHGKALACHVICLSMAFSCLAATQIAGHAFSNTACSVMAYLIQFSFVSCFFWLNVMCFDTYLNVRRYIKSSVSRRSMRRRFFWYSVYAITLPVILLIITITMDLSPTVPSSYLKPGFGVKGCWFKTDQAALPYFYGPVAVILVTNVIIFFFTSRAFAVHYDKLKDVTALELAHSDFSNSDDWVRLGAALGETIPANQRSNSLNREPLNFTQQLKKYRKIFRTCCLLSVLMGLSWVMEVVSWAAGGDSLTVWNVFDVVNSLQGVVIFVIYVMQAPVWGIVKSTICIRRSSSEVTVFSERTSLGCLGRRDYV